MKIAEKADKVLDKFLHYVENLENFAKEQVPDYITQLLEYEAWDHLFAMKIHLGFAGLCAVLVVMAIITFGIILKKDPDFVGFALLPGAVMGILFMAFTWHGMSHYRAAKKIEMAPKVYVLDYLRNK